MTSKLSTKPRKSPASASRSSVSTPTSASSSGTLKRKPTPRPGTQGFCFATPTVMPQGDGTYLVKPGKPRAELTPAQAAREMGTHRSTVYAYVDAGLLVKVRRPSPRRLLLDAAEVAELREATADSEYWTPEKRKALAAAKGHAVYEAMRARG